MDDGVWRRVPVSLGLGWKSRLLFGGRAQDSDVLVIRLVFYLACRARARRQHEAQREEGSERCSASFCQGRLKVVILSIERGGICFGAVYGERGRRGAVVRERVLPTDRSVWIVCAVGGAFSRGGVRSVQPPHTERIRRRGALRWQLRLQLVRGPIERRRRHC